MTKLKTYTPEFKAEAVRLVRDEKVSPSKVAADLGVSHTSLASWLKNDAASRSPAAAPPPNPLEEELRKLRAENRVLQMERDILKKAAAFFAKESL